MQSGLEAKRGMKRGIEFCMACKYYNCDSRHFRQIDESSRLVRLFSCL